MKKYLLGKWEKKKKLTSTLFEQEQQKIYLIWYTDTMHALPNSIWEINFTLNAYQTCIQMSEDYEAFLENEFSFVVFLDDFNPCIV